MKILSYFSFYKKNRKLLETLAVVLLLSTLYGSQSVAVWSNNIALNDGAKRNAYEGYIIKFDEEPISIFENRVRNEMKNLFLHLNEKTFNYLLAKRVLEHKNKILSIHWNVKENILKLVNKNSEDIFLKEFSVLFNGMLVKKLPDVILEKIEELPNVDFIAPDYEIKIALNDSIQLINADDIYDLNDECGKKVTGRGINVAIIDTGMDYNHPDLKDNFVGGYDFVNNDNDPIDDNGHGTHCAGIIAGTGLASDFKFVGVAPDVELYVYKVMDKEGNGYTSWFIEGMEKAVDPNGDGNFSDHVDIISISAGDSSGYPDDAISTAANNAVDLGIVVVAAAGNSGPSYGTISSPGCAKRVICVGSTDKNDEIASFSSRGSNYAEIVKPDVVAPGTDIVSAWPGKNYRSLSGTSMACPHVTGVVALTLQMHPYWTPDEIKIALRNTAVDLGYNLTTQGYGKIDALSIVTLSDVPPISILNISGEIQYGLVNICGTALADNFQNYSLHYKKTSKYGQSIDWIKLYEGNEEVDNSILFRWDTCQLHSGVYELKLEVKSQNQTSVDIAFISLKPRNNDQKLLIFAPDEINEFERFTVKVTDMNNTPQTVWFLLTFPHNRPKIRFGFSATFKAPIILNQQIESLEGTLTVFKMCRGYKISKMYLTVVNN